MKNEHWTPNHFVPLLLIWVDEETLGEDNQTTATEEVKHTHGEIWNNRDIVHVDTGEQTPIRVSPEEVDNANAVCQDELKNEMENYKTIVDENENVGTKLPAVNVISYQI